MNIVRSTISLDESIEDIFKPKSEEEYSKGFKDMSPEKIIVIGIKKGLEFFVLKGIEMGALINNIIFIKCISKNFVKAVDKILKLNILDKHELNTGFQVAILEEKKDIVELFLKNTDIDISYENNICLSLALYTNNTAIINLLNKDLQK